MFDFKLRHKSVKLGQRLGRDKSLQTSLCWHCITMNVYSRKQKENKLTRNSTRVHWKTTNL